MKNNTITKKVKKTTKKAYLSQIITADNIQKLGEQTAKRALNTIYAGNNQKAKKQATETTKETKTTETKSVIILPPETPKASKNANDNNKFILTLIKDLNHDIKHKNDIKHIFSDAYDIAQNAITTYCEFIGQKLSAFVKNGETDKNGNAINIYTYCLRIINRYIISNKSKVYKTVYLQDIDKNGEIIEIPQKWDMPTISDYKQVTETIKNMCLSVTEKKVLYARLRGLSYETIAKKLSITKRNAFLYVTKIQKKYNALCGKIETQTPKTVLQAEKNKTAYMQIDGFMDDLTPAQSEIIHTYNLCNQNISETARILNKTRQAIQNALKRLDKKISY